MKTLILNGSLRINCPVLLILGARDNTDKVRAYSQQWTQRTGFGIGTYFLKEIERACIICEKI